MTHIHVLTPSLGRVSLRYRDTFAALAVACMRKEYAIKLTVSDATDAGHLAHARNVLFRNGIDSGATHCLWWDADVSFDVAGVFDLLERPEAMIARPYPLRAVDLEGIADYLLEVQPEVRSELNRYGEARIKLASLRWPIQLYFREGKPVWSADKKLVRIRHCGMGWVLMKREAMQAFADWSGKYIARDWRNRPLVPAFNFLENIHGQIGCEDISFCWRWGGDGLSFGGEIWAAPDRIIANWEQAGRFADYLDAHGLGPA